MILEVDGVVFAQFLAGAFDGDVSAAVFIAQIEHLVALDLVGEDLPDPNAVWGADGGEAIVFKDDGNGPA